ncbi:hypothetical protein [Dielma fastidiosa]|uniref:Uncharacterized protein n=1 Tax=Dielma fastidiosa TaxID=1034346 RepID=A0A318LET2_9FIRM|nr:hypothetical protein [Dielma fastidiosa]MDY5168261.1 hypothetical protein [Dielma fastidiosa]PXX80147.1 hypothetical protein DES51_104152 [Dielma fastidiosa]
MKKEKVIRITNHRQQAIYWSVSFALFGAANLISMLNNWLLIVPAAYLFVWYRFDKHYVEENIGYKEKRSFKDLLIILPGIMFMRETSWYIDIFINWLTQTLGSMLG